tara:strand:+ start:270 stop:527 length:258 start_codon:yes stop_codon:yes gene_type:complete
MLVAENLSVLDLKDGQDLEVRQLDHDGNVKMKPGLYANIHAKRKRIADGSGEKMRKKGAAGAPTNANFKRAAKTAKKPNKKSLMA